MVVPPPDAAGSPGPAGARAGNQGCSSDRKPVRFPRASLAPRRSRAGRRDRWHRPHFLPRRV